MNTPTITELQRALEAVALARTPMFHLQRLTLTDLLISREGQHAVGIWRRSANGLTFTLFGYSTPTHQAETLEAAVHITQTLIGSN